MGVDKGVFFSIATKPSQQKSINDFCASIASDTVIPFGSVHPDAPDWEPGTGAHRGSGAEGDQAAPGLSGFRYGRAPRPALFKMPGTWGWSWRFTQDLTLFLRNISIAAPAPPPGAGRRPWPSADSRPHGRYAPVGRCGTLAGGRSRSGWILPAAPAKSTRFS